MEVRKEEVFICECNTVEHQIIFKYDEDYNETEVYVHLSQYLNFFQRIVAGFKYIFGYKSKYGEFDNFILNHEDAERLSEHLKLIKKS